MHVYARVHVSICVREKSCDYCTHAMWLVGCGGVGTAGICHDGEGYAAWGKKGALVMPVQAIVDTHREHAELLSSVRDDLRSHPHPNPHPPSQSPIPHPLSIHTTHVHTVWLLAVRTKSM